MPTFLAPLVILCAAVFAILVILYRIYETRVEQPKKLEDELKEALGGAKPEVESVEPVRQAAMAVSYAANRIVIIRKFGKIPPRIYTVDKLVGIEVFVDDKVAARVMRAGPHKMLDDIAPVVHRVAIRMIFDDPSHPDYELVLWDPHDALTARAEGPRAAMETARKWFYHVEAILRSTIRPPRPVTGAPPAAAPVPTSIVAEPPPVPTSPPPAPEPIKVATPPAPIALPPAPSKADGDVLNAPLIPYI